MVYLLIRRIRYEGSDVLLASTDAEKLRAYMRDQMEVCNLETREIRDSEIEWKIQESRRYETETGCAEKPAAEIASEWDYDHLMRERDGVWYRADMSWEIVEMPLI